MVLLGAEALPFLATEAGGPPRRDVADAPTQAPARPQAGRPARAPSTTTEARPDQRKEIEKLCLINRPDRPKTPPFPRDLEWIRSPGVPLEEAMRGRVVLIEVWESSCINCLRNMPILSALHRRYAPYGLLVLGIHSSEFSFTSSRVSVERAVRRFGLEFSIAADVRKTFWNKWDVPGWPTTYLLDDRGLLASMHTGELTATKMEKSVRTLLMERQPGLRFPDPPAPSQDQIGRASCRERV